MCSLQIKLFLQIICVIPTFKKIESLVNLQNPHPRTFTVESQFCLCGPPLGKGE